MSSFIGGLIGLTLLAALLGPAFGLALILPGLVPHFFTGGAAGVYGNATGGRRGAIAGAFVNGLLVTFLPAFLLKVLGSFGSANTTFGDADFGWFGILIGCGSRAGVVPGAVILTLIGAIILLSAIAVQKRVVKGDGIQLRLGAPQAMVPSPALAKALPHPAGRTPRCPRPAVESRVLQEPRDLPPGRISGCDAAHPV